MGAFLLLFLFFLVHIVFTFQIQALWTHILIWHLDNIGGVFWCLYFPLLSRRRKYENREIKMYLSNNSYSNLRRRLGVLQSRCFFQGCSKRLREPLLVFIVTLNISPCAFFLPSAHHEGWTSAEYHVLLTGLVDSVKVGWHFFVPRFDHSAHMRGKKALAHKRRQSSARPVRRWDIRQNRTGPCNSF